MTGRTTSKWVRVYVDGWDLSGYGRSIGPLLWEFDAADLTAPMGDSVRGYLPNLCNISPGVFNGVLSTTTDSGVELSRIQTAGTQRDIMVPVGMRTTPTDGDPVYVCKAAHNGFHVAEDAGAMVVNAEFGSWDGSDLVVYPVPWGTLVVPKGTFTTTTDGTEINTGLDTQLGGYMAYQIFTGSSGGWTIKLTDSLDGDVYADVEGLTVSIADASTPCAGIVQTTAKTTQIEPYVQAVMTEDSAGTLVCAVAFVRGGGQ